MQKLCSVRTPVVQLHGSETLVGTVKLVDLVHEIAFAQMGIEVDDHACLRCSDKRNGVFWPLFNAAGAAANRQETERAPTAGTPDLRRDARSRGKSSRRFP